MVYHELGTEGRNYDLAGLRGAVSAAAETRDRTLTVGLDSVGFIDAEVIRELIKGLRHLRETGGAIRLKMTRASSIASMRMMGLDRVFTIV
jgi:anti-anti-sigma regulatory factor